MFDPFFKPIKHPANKEKYEEFEAYRERMGLDFTQNSYFGTNRQLREKYDADPSLRNIPLKYFYPYHPALAELAYRSGIFWWSHEDTVNLIKHCLIYQNLEAVPVFTDEG